MANASAVGMLNRGLISISELQDGAISAPLKTHTLTELRTILRLKADVDTDDIGFDLGKIECGNALL